MMSSNAINNSLSTPATAATSNVINLNQTNKNNDANVTIDVPTLSTNTNYLEWEWYHIYHFIMTLNNNHFIKYGQSLHDHLKSENIKGIKLKKLTPNDWFKFGITDPNDVEMLIDSINNLNNCNTNTTSIHTKSDTHTNTKNDKSDIDSTDEPINKQNNMYMINGEVVNNIHSTLYHNEMQKNQLINNCNLLYVYAQQINSELTNEHNKRINIEQALTQITEQSQTQSKILNDALVKAYTQQSFLSNNYGKLQNMYAEQTNILEEKQNLLETFEIKYEEIDDKYVNKCGEYKELLLQHKELQNKYNEMNFKLQAKCSELEYKYKEINEKYIVACNEKESYDKLNNIKVWDFNDVYIWMIGLDNGYFEKYESLYESLEIQNINGESLCEWDIDDINRCGINDVMDQRRILANIRILIKNYSDSSTISDDNSIYDFANIDLFGN